MTWIIGHRGSPRVQPENTPASYLAALAEGADGVELDIHETADGRFLLHHDAATAAGPIAGLTAAETAHRLAANHTAAVPRLEEALEAIAAARPQPVVLVEVKAMRRWSRLTAALAPWRERLCLEVQSFDPALLAEAATAPAGLALGLIARTPPAPDAGGWLRAHRLQSLSLHHLAVRPDTVPALHAAGLGCYLWTVNAPSAVAAAWERRPDGIITDVPAAVRFYAAGP